MRRIGFADGHAALDVPALLTDNQLMVQVTSRQARCAGADVDADEWFPVATRWGKARAPVMRITAQAATKRPHGESGDVPAKRAPAMRH